MNVRTVEKASLCTLEHNQMNTVTAAPCICTHTYNIIHVYINYSDTMYMTCIVLLYGTTCIITDVTTLRAQADEVYTHSWPVQLLPDPPQSGAEGWLPLQVADTPVGERQPGSLSLRREGGKQLGDEGEGETALLLHHSRLLCV